MPTSSAEKADLHQWANERGYLNIRPLHPEGLIEAYEDFRAWQAKKIEDRGYPLAGRKSGD